MSYIKVNRRYISENMDYIPKSMKQPGWNNKKSLEDSVSSIRETNRNKQKKETIYIAPFFVL